MSDIDISDLPAPDAMDISDLPAPPAPSGLSGELDAALHGAQREGMGLGNITDRILPSSMQIPGTSKQDLQNFDQAHAGEFANNKIGKFAGQALPLVLAQFIPGLDVGVDAGVGEQLASLGANAALGGLGSAATADPNHQLSAGLEGAALGGGLAGGGQLLKNARVGLSPEAQRLSQYIQQGTGEKPFIPIAASAPEGSAVGRFYRSVLPDITGTGRTFRGQMGDLQGNLRQAAVQNASPAGGVAAGKPWQQLPGLKDQFDQAYGSVMSRWQQPQGMTPGHIGGEVLNQILAKAPDIDPNVALSVAQKAQDMVTSRVPGTGSNALTGPALQNAWNAVGQRVGGSQGEEKAAWLAARNALDNFRQIGLSTPDQTALAALNSKYAEFAPVQSAINSSKGNSGNFTAGQLARKAQRGTSVLQAAQDLRSLGNSAAELGRPVGNYAQGGNIGRVLQAIGLPMSSKAVQRGLQGGLGNAAGTIYSVALPSLWG